MSESSYGFIGIIQYEDGRPSLYVPSISNVSWDEATHAWYEQQRQSRGGLIFSKLDNLFGRGDPQYPGVLQRSAGAIQPVAVSPRGHPHLESFLGIPIRHKGRRSA